VGDGPETPKGQADTPLLVESVLGEASPEDLRVKGWDDWYLAIGKDWRYWVYSPRSFAEAM
jgi:hypothetical protein